MVARIVNAAIGGTARPVDLLNGIGGLPVAGQEPPVGGPTGITWTRSFTEEFGEANLAALTAPGLWQTGWFGTGVTGPVNSLETAFYDPALVTVSGGVATMGAVANSTSKAPPGWATAIKPNLGGQLNTDPNQVTPGYMFGYGYIEARFQQPAGNTTENLWPAFWMTGHNWPTEMEIDILEGNGTDAGCAFNVHYGTTVGVDSTNLNSTSRVKTVTGATSGFHTYAAHIRSTDVTFYYDGVNVGGYTGTVPNAQRFLMFGNTTAGTLTTQKTLIMDYIRAWIDLGGLGVTPLGTGPLGS